MTGARDITQLCCSSNLAGIVANQIEQSFYSVYSYSGIDSIERALRSKLQRYASINSDIAEDEKSVGMGTSRDRVALLSPLSHPWFSRMVTIHCLHGAWANHETKWEANLI